MEDFKYITIRGLIVKMLSVALLFCFGERPVGFTLLWCVFSGRSRWR